MQLKETALLLSLSRLITACPCPGAHLCSVPGYALQAAIIAQAAAPQTAVVCNCRKRVGSFCHETVPPERDLRCQEDVSWSLLHFHSKPGLTQPLQHHMIHRQGLTSGATGLSPPGPTPPRADPPLVFTVMLLRDTPGVPRSPRLGRTMGSAVIGSEWSRALMSAANCQTSSLAWVMDSCRQTGDSAVVVWGEAGRQETVLWWCGGGGGAGKHRLVRALSWVGRLQE